MATKEMLDPLNLKKGTIVVFIIQLLFMSGTVLSLFASATEFSASDSTVLGFQVVWSGLLFLSFVLYAIYLYLSDLYHTSFYMYGLLIGSYTFLTLFALQEAVLLGRYATSNTPALVSSVTFLSFIFSLGVFNIPGLYVYRHSFTSKPLQGLHANHSSEKNPDKRPIDSAEQLPA